MMLFNLSCHWGNERDYRLLTVNECFVDFSFEYPTDYIEPIINPADASVGSFRYTLSGGQSTIDNERMRVLFHIIAEPVGKYHENYMSIRSGAYGSEIDFNLIDDKPVKTGEITGQLVVYSSTLPIYQVKSITRMMFFELSDTIFVLSMAADEKYVKQAKADFDHILRTFKILP